ncbi:DUF4259 domain-containing protein [Janthinobacterium fluminis]|uniref:DUF4259 domain-containing protein n=1 Tax=Janthinobacterium fluminis TaxID=2987524 RepID=A0ABT5K1C9_9BURK|nr:DUF4259 domain-containing protein [Janthinobacterium fluminis]MDC8758784.1 DUF4259 domain-containing protein [Janthinobacterium fluminis]
MGTWSVDTYGNDYALDWAQDLQETSNLEPIESTLDYALGDGELEAPLGAEALAAVDVLARLQGNADGATGAHMQDIERWVAQRKQQVSPALAGKALRAVERILGEQSELCRLWRDSAHYEEWRAAVLALKARVRVA